MDAVDRVFATRHVVLLFLKLVLRSNTSWQPDCLDRNGLFSVAADWANFRHFDDTIRRTLLTFAETDRAVLEITLHTSEKRFLRVLYNTREHSDTPHHHQTR